MDLMEHRVLDQMQSYTWSTNCLFVALPTAVLQGMSLGSILVDPRTGHLDITLPSFCCKVCESKREKMIEDVIAEVSVNLLVDVYYTYLVFKKMY